MCQVEWSFMTYDISILAQSPAGTARFVCIGKDKQDAAGQRAYSSSIKADSTMNVDIEIKELIKINVSLSPKHPPFTHLILSLLFYYTVH